MSLTLDIGATGMLAQQLNVDTISNNIAKKLFKSSVLWFGKKFGILAFHLLGFCVLLRLTKFFFAENS